MNAGNPKVISVFENKGRKLHTTHSWNFLGVENDVGIPSNSIWNDAKFGEDVIVANIDTGNFNLFLIYFFFFLNIYKSSQVLKTKYDHFLTKIVLKLFRI